MYNKEGLSRILGLIPTFSKGEGHLHTALSLKEYGKIEFFKNGNQRYDAEVVVIKIIKGIQHRSFSPEKEMEDEAWVRDELFFHIIALNQKDAETDF